MAATQVMLRESDNDGLAGRPMLSHHYCKSTCNQVNGHMHNVYISVVEPWPNYGAILFHIRSGVTSYRVITSLLV